MPYCARCEVEYQDGFTVCADCGSMLVDALPEPEEPEEWSFLTQVARDAEARLVQGRLEAEGIPCTLESRTFSAEPMPSVQALMRVLVHVPAADLDRARAVLAACEAAAESAEPETEE